MSRVGRVGWGRRNGIRWTDRSHRAPPHRGCPPAISILPNSLCNSCVIYAMICHCSYFAHCMFVCVRVCVYLLELRPVGVHNAWTVPNCGPDNRARLGHAKRTEGRAIEPVQAATVRLKGVRGLVVCIVGLNVSTTVGLETKQKQQQQQ